MCAIGVSGCATEHGLRRLILLTTSD